MTAPTHEEASRALVALRDETARLVTWLHRRYADFDLAEEAVQGALLEAVTAWPKRGIPDEPIAWMRVAAQRNAIDLIRRNDRYRRTLARVGESLHTEETAAPPPDNAPESADASADDRLALLFACCHPALAPEARLALTLRAVLGLTTPQIARAFLVSEATLAQRIVRAKRKITDAGIALRVPGPEELPARLDDVLTVVTVMFNEAFVNTRGPSQDRELAAEALWLAEALTRDLPDAAEAWGLAALLGFHHARARARFADGELVILAAQDRALWDRALIARAEEWLGRAAALRSPGRFQLQAAIAACHATGPSWAATDWRQLLLLYDALVAVDPSPVIQLNRAVVRAQLGPPEWALADVDRLAPDLDSYHLFHATRAELLRRTGREGDAQEADARALELTGNEAERRLLRTRLRNVRLDHES